MSMCWYLYSYPVKVFERVFSSATKGQEGKLMKLITDPDEGFEDEEEQEAAVELAGEMLHDGITMEGKSEEEKDMMDRILGLAMHEVGLGKELKVKPRSPEAITLKVADELVRNAGAVDGTLIGLFKRGRRYGLSEGRRHDCYFFLRPEEVVALKEEVERLLGKADVKWPHPDFPKEIRSNLAEPLGKVAQSPGEGLYARLG
jgi:hypothetical protein